LTLLFLFSLCSFCASSSYSSSFSLLTIRIAIYRPATCRPSNPTTHCYDGIHYTADLDLGSLMIINGSWESSTGMCTRIRTRLRLQLWLLWLDYGAFDLGTSISITVPYSGSNLTRLVLSIYRFIVLRGECLPGLGCRRPTLQVS
jgi:hypothetical protein